jgi:hypothetical protein
MQTHLGNHREENEIGWTYSTNGADKKYVTTLGGRCEGTGVGIMK